MVRLLSNPSNSLVSIFLLLYSLVSNDPWNCESAIRFLPLSRWIWGSLAAFGGDGMLPFL